MWAIEEYLHQVMILGGSDLHLASGSPPLMRQHGVLKPLDSDELPNEPMLAMLWNILNEEQRFELEEQRNVDFAWETDTPDGKQRVRASCMYHMDGIHAVFRIIPNHIPPLNELGLPTDVLKSLVAHHQGLVLVTGPSGSGKSTTLAALIDIINKNERKKIITIEDPIEFIHINKLSLIDQRQISVHTRSFSSALKAAVREDPDVVLVGELRDQETVQLAITAAETGHLVLSTMHTSSASKTIDRIVGTFPSGQQPQIRTMLAESLRGVLSQVLIPAAAGLERIPAVEILVGCLPLSNIIREGRSHQIASVMATGKNIGMRSMDESLRELVATRRINKQDAYLYAEDKNMVI